MSIKQFLDIEVGSTIKKILNTKNEVLWEGIHTIKNDIPKNLLCTDIIKWSVNNNIVILWVDEEMI